MIDDGDFLRQATCPKCGNQDLLWEELEPGLWRYIDAETFEPHVCRKPIQTPTQTRTGAHVAWYVVVDGVPVAVFQPGFEPAHLDAPPCLPSGCMLDCGGPAVGLALWWGR